jgi:hypothetical protein
VAGPAAVQVQAQGLYVTKSPGAVGLTKTFRDPGSIKEYKALLAPGRRRFLALVELRPLTTLRKKFSILVRKQNIMESGSDGGLSAGIATMGYVVTDSKEVIGRGSGPVDGDICTANSRRSELYGFAGLCELLLMMQTIIPECAACSKAEVRVRIWMDSTSAIKQIRKILVGHKAPSKYPPDADIIGHIRWLSTQLRAFDISIDWVKAHQDDTIAHEKLLVNAKINILADELATSYRELMPKHRQKSRSQAVFFSASKVSLKVNGLRTTSQYEESIRYHIHGTRLRKFLQTTRLWDDVIWNMVDMESLGLAMGKLDVSRRISVSKMIYGWNNTGHQRKKITPDASSNCPRCGLEDETQEHVLQCNDRSAKAARYNAIVKLRSSVVTRVGGSASWTALVRGCQFWLEKGKDPHIDMFKGIQLEESLWEVLREALHSQERIGWRYALRGFLSIAWIDLQAREMKMKPHNVRQSWSPVVLKGIWTLGDTMWHHRNEKLHESAVSTRMITESSLDAKIQSYYNSQHNFAVSDRHLFDIPVEVRLQTSRRSKKHWIYLVAQYKASTQERRDNGQQKITQFYFRIPD